MAVSEGETPLRMRASNSASPARASRPSLRSASREMAPSASPVSRIQCAAGAPRRGWSVFGASTKTARAPADWMVATGAGGGKLRYLGGGVEALGEMAKAARENPKRVWGLKATAAPF